MANVFDVAEYVLSEVENPLTTMKLQKLVYYCQAWSLAWDEQPLFDEEFEAWANGPVCRELFEQHKGSYVVNKGHFISMLSNSEFSDNQLETMDAVIEFYGDKDPHWLSELTHKELPWREARGNCKELSYCTKVIDKFTMQTYYIGLSNE